MTLPALGLQVEDLTPSRPRRPSAVSQVLRRIGDEPIAGPWELDSGSGLRLLVANDLQTRRRAYELAYRVYRACGYVPQNDQGMCAAPYDLERSTLTFLVQDAAGTGLATVSLVFDSHRGLPCDEVFGAEIRALRAQGRKLAEVTRLALDRSQAQNKALLIRLFNFLYIAAYRVRGADDFVIEVNPRHVGFYRRLLLLEELGAERPCPRVNAAPAVLLRLDLHACPRWMREAQHAGLRRTLYARSYGPQEEMRAAHFLRKAQRPMTAREAVHFQLLPAQAVAAFEEGRA